MIQRQNWSINSIKNLMGQQKRILDMEEDKERISQQERETYNRLQQAENFAWEAKNIIGISTLPAISRECLCLYATVGKLTGSATSVVHSGDDAITWKKKQNLKLTSTSWNKTAILQVKR